MNNIRHAEEAMRKEYEESKNAGADPFTRQACRPVLGEWRSWKIEFSPSTLSGDSQCLKVQSKIAMSMIYS